MHGYALSYVLSNLYPSKRISCTNEQALCEYHGHHGTKQDNSRTLGCQVCVEPVWTGIRQCSVIQNLFSSLSKTATSTLSLAIELLAHWILQEVDCFRMTKTCENKFGFCQILWGLWTANARVMASSFGMLFQLSSYQRVHGVAGCRARSLHLTLAISPLLPNVC